MQEEILNLLENIGLRDKEAKIYIACLQESEGLYPFEIVERTDLNRSTVDVLIDKMMASRHLSRVRVGARYKYFAKDPHALYHEQTQLLNTFKGLLPILDQLTAKKSDMEIRFFEGLEGIAEIHRDMTLRLRLGQAVPNEQLLISSWKGVLNDYPDYMDIVTTRIRQRIPIRILAPLKSARGVWSDDPKELRRVRTFDARRFPFNIHLAIYGPAINIISPVEPLGSTLIVNDVISNSMRSLFDLMWHSNAVAAPDA